MENSVFHIAEQLLWAPTALSSNAIEATLSKMMGQNVDYAELFFQSVCSESWSIEESIVKSASFSQEQGVGARVISGEKTGFAYTEDLSKSAIQQAGIAARSIAAQGQNGQVHLQSSQVTRTLYPTVDPLQSLTADQKVGLLQNVDRLARAADPRVIQVMASLSAVYEVIMVVASDQTWVADVRPLVRFNVSVIMEENGRREQGYAGGGGRASYAEYVTDAKIAAYVQEAVRQARVNLTAIPAPAGLMPVVLGPGWPGVLLHEAVGHGLEGDFNRKEVSAFSNRLNQQVASPLCTVVDDGTLPGRRGSLTVDDEGTPTQKNILIENGILKGYMQDKHNARLMKTKSTGNGRRESYASLTLPRMTNTYMLPGKSDPDEMIASVDKGIYAVNFSGGQVDITSGKFVFSASEAYLIEKGKVTAPIKGATLIGSGPEAMTQISMVGNDLQLDTGIGVCGKDGQSVCVGVGQPTLKIDSMTVGGTEQQ